MDNNANKYIVAIVAIVAIVSLIVLFTGNKSVNSESIEDSQLTDEEALEMQLSLGSESGDLVGEATSVLRGSSNCVETSTGVEFEFRGRTFSRVDQCSLDGNKENDWSCKRGMVIRKSTECEFGCSETTGTCLGNSPMNRCEFVNPDYNIDINIVPSQNVYRVGEPVDGDMFIENRGEDFNALIYHTKSRVGFEPREMGEYGRRMPLSGTYSPFLGITAFRMDEEGGENLIESFTESGDYVYGIKIFHCDDILESMGFDCNDEDFLSDFRWEIAWDTEILNSINPVAADCIHVKVVD